jgi:ParB/RepB/Spo0J family partition protein
MADNQYREIDPYAVAVSDMNERRGSPVTSSIQESIEKQGVIQPPLVRERDAPDDAEVPYEAVVGQRRVLGAQAASGVDTIPVVVVGWDDAEALEASITENIEVFSEDVSGKDRAEAIVRLMEMRGYNQTQLADSLGVTPDRVHQWVERGREEWEGTVFHAGAEDDGTERSISETARSPDNLDDDSLRHIRQSTGGGEEAERMALSVAEEDMTHTQTLEAAKRVRQGADPEVAVEEVAEEQQKQTETTQRSEIRFTLSGDEAEALTTAATQWGATENQVARKVILRYLDTEGFLGGDGS